jgi:DNA-binding transcriptional ArsR family regulator
VEPFPQEIKSFLDGNIESIDQLEILRLLGENPERSWDVESLATEVQTDPATVAAHLTAMGGRGLITLEIRGTEILGRYGPAAAVADLVVRLLQLYKERPVSMIKMVYDRAKDPLRNFAEACRIRKEGS